MHKSKHFWNDFISTYIFFKKTLFNVKSKLFLSIKSWSVNLLSDSPTYIYLYAKI